MLRKGGVRPKDVGYQASAPCIIGLVLSSFVNSREGVEPKPDDALEKSVVPAGTVIKRSEVLVI